MKTINLLVKPEKLDGGIIRLSVKRADLEILVEHSKILKKRQGHIKKPFYYYDMHVAQRLQNENSCLLFYADELDRDKRMIIFNAIKHDGHKLNSGEVQLVVHELDHLTCIRFAYSVYKLIEQNWKRYPIIRKDFIHVGPPKPDIYLEQSLVKYLIEDSNSNN